MKKIITALLMAALLVTGVYANDEIASAEETKIEYSLPEKVEIAFKVGDDVLKINGEDVTTETAPYVVETSSGGVTLVPVRVITEAFGAKVGWEESTQTVTLDYPDVQIILQIGNPVAEVNGEAVILLTAPELPGGRTMVPLRFISESFGAEVGYDDATQSITVVKENAAEDGTVIEGAIDTAYIGDSYYGWIIENPKDMDMTERTFDGTRTRFKNESTTLVIDVLNKPEDYDFDKEFKDLREYWSKDYTLVKAETDTSDETAKKIHLQIRTETVFGDLRYVVTDKYRFSTLITCTLESGEKDSAIALADTFSLNYNFADTHDLSNLENGMRKFESKELNFTLYLPADVNNVSEETKMNEFNFVSQNGMKTMVKLQIYSKSQLERSAKEQVEKDMKDTTDCINESYKFVKGVDEITYGDAKAYTYEMKITGSKSNDTIWKEVMFEKGEYAYRLVMYVDKKYENPEQIISYVFDSAVFGEIDAEKVGLLLPPADEEVYEMKEYNFGEYLIDVPQGYETSSNATASAYTDNRLVVITQTTASVPGYSVEDYASALLRQMTLQPEYSTEEHVRRENLGKGTFYRFVIKTELEGELVYTAVYITEKKGSYYIFQFNCSDLYYSNFHTQLAEKIVGSMREPE